METKPRFLPYVSDLKLIHQGKVRDTYEIPGHHELLLMVATDRISTHDVVHLSVVPKNGEILTAMTVFWQENIFYDIPTHIVAFGSEIYDYLPKDQSYRADLHLRALVVYRLVMVPYELIFRARMAGSLWKKFYSQGVENPYELALPPGLRLMDQIDPPAFTPTEKSETDDPVRAESVRQRYPDAVALAHRAYTVGWAHALARGIDIIDAKFEIGLDTNAGMWCLADEFLTGDCSRFVRSADIQVGVEPPWMDKEVFRNDAVLQWGGKTKGSPLVFSHKVIMAGVSAYREAFETLTWSTLERFQVQHF